MQTRPITLLPLISDAQVLDTITACATTIGYSVLPAMDPSQAAPQLDELNPDLLLLDSPAQELAEQTNQRPSLLLTENTDPAYLYQQVQNGFDDFLFLPLNQAWLNSRLQQQFSRIEGQRFTARFKRQTLKLRELGELVGLISHEVASPLGNVNTAVSFLLESSERIRTSFDEKTLAANDLDKFLKQMHKALSMCVKNSDNAGGIISSFRSVATNQCLEQIQQFYLHRYIDEIILSLKSKLKKLPHEIHVVISEAVDMVSDAGAFAQVISALINKSISYGFDDNVPGQIIINGGMEERDGVKTIVLNFIDNGKGMDQQTLDELLDNDREGLGHSLTTAMLKKIVEEQLGGTMEVQSTQDKGTHFTLIMPQQLQ